RRVAQLVGERLAGERDVEAGAVGPVRLQGLARAVLLGEEDLLLGAVLCPPAPHPALEGADLAVRVPSGHPFALAHGAEERLRLELRALRAPELLHHPRPVGRVERVLACAPGPLRTRLG